MKTKYKVMIIIIVIAVVVGTFILLSQINKKIENNNVSNNIEQNVQTSQTSTNPIRTDDEEAAIEIVKDNWGENDAVYFSYDGKNAQGRYIITVRDKTTTNEIVRYFVDLENRTFDIE